MSETQSNNEKIVKDGKIKIGDLGNISVFNAARKLANYEFDARTSYWLGKAIKKIEDHGKDIDLTRERALKKYAELTESGEFKIENNAVAFKEKDGEKKFREEMEAFLLTEVDVLFISGEALLKGAGDSKLKIPASVFTGIDPLLF